MNDGTYQKVLATFGVASAPPSPAFLTWVAEQKASREVVELFAEGVPLRRRGRVHDRWEFFTEREILKEAEAFPRYLKAGLLSLGSCVNGDPIAIDIRKNVGVVGYISHEDVWGDDETPVRKHFKRVASSPAEFARGVRDRSLPIDYEEARRRK